MLDAQVAYRAAPGADTEVVLHEYQNEQAHSGWIGKRVGRFGAHPHCECGAGNY